MDDESLCVVLTDSVIMWLVCVCAVGDVGYFESDGHVIISDRLKELIKYKGYQVL